MADLEEKVAGLEGELGEDGETPAEAVEKYDNMTPEQQEEVKEVFDMFDKENNQTIEKGMLSTVMRWLKFNPTEREMNELFKKYDPNNTGIITLKQVMTIMNMKMLDSDTIDELIEAMKLFDTDHDGKVTVPEFRWAMTKLGDVFEEQQVDEILKEIDKEGTGFVDVLEFSKTSFNIKEEKPKGEKKDAKKDDKKDAKKKK